MNKFLLLIVCFSSIASAGVNMYSGLGLGIGRIEHIEETNGRKGFLLTGAGSSSLVGRRLVLTAQHTMNLKNGKLDTRNVPHYCARCDYAYGNVPGGTPTRIIDFRAGNGPGAGGTGYSVEQTDYSGDWAIAILESEPKTDSYGVAPIPVAHSNSLRPGDTLKIMGYPNSHEAGTRPIESECPLIKNIKGMLFYKCDGTGGGSSGSPVMAKINGEWSVVGIHVAGFTGKWLETLKAHYGIDETGTVSAASASENFISTFDDLARSYGDSVARGSATPSTSSYTPRPSTSRPAPSRPAPSSSNVDLDEVQRKLEALQRKMMLREIEDRLRDLQRRQR